jgi:hypothetical protein
LYLKSLTKSVIYAKINKNKGVEEEGALVPKQRETAVGVSRSEVFRVVTFEPRGRKPIKVSRTSP